MLAPHRGAALSACPMRKDRHRRKSAACTSHPLCQAWRGKRLEKGWVRLWFCVRLVAPLPGKISIRGHGNGIRLRPYPRAGCACAASGWMGLRPIPRFPRSFSLRETQHQCGRCRAGARRGRSRGPPRRSAERATGEGGRPEARKREGRARRVARTNATQGLTRAVGESSLSRPTGRVPRQGQLREPQASRAGGFGGRGDVGAPRPPEASRARQPGRTPKGESWFL